MSEKCSLKSPLIEGLTVVSLVKTDGLDDNPNISDMDFIVDNNDQKASCSATDCRQGCADAMAYWYEEMDNWKYMQNGKS